MTIVRRLAVCAACLAGLAPALAAALELGPIEARSALYEPLDARIPIRGAQSGDLGGLNVALGSPAQFELAGVARLEHLGLLEFVVVEEGEGDGYIHVRTSEPIIEQSLTFLVDVDWPRGRTVRGYKLRLAPAARGATEAGGIRRATPESRPETGGAPDEPPAPEARSETGGASATPASGGAGYGPVRNSETLWSIASRLRPDTSVSTQRMMLAILEANPGAFTIGNINGLKAGATLRIPVRDEIGPDRPQAANAEVRRQHAEWLEHRKSSSVRAAPPDSGAQPGGRIEVVSPGTATDATEPEDGAEVSALRRELALAAEEADASRRENDELKLRLADAEDYITELNRLVALKDEEIAALQAELSALPATTPAPAEAEASAGAENRIVELNRLVALKDEEIAGLRDELSALSEATPAQAAEPSPLPAPDRTEPAAATEEATKPIPFGLGNLPVNPVFLVGGAGLILLLLGVLALLRRRRASTAAEEDVFEIAEEAPSGEDPLLVELEAVAAELSEQPEEPPARPTRAGSGDSPDERTVSGPQALQAARSGPDAPMEEQIAALWRDEDDRASERGRPAGAAADEDTAGDTFEIDALIDDDPAPDAHPDRPGRDAEAAGPAVEPEVDRVEAGPARAAGEAGVGPVRAAGDHGAGMADPDSSDPASTTGALALEDVGEDEAQTKIDLAQVYMEMGDTESARGFLEAVLVEGDAGQRDIARDMLSKLS